MLDLRFEAEVDDKNRIAIPPEVAREIPAHSRVEVALHIKKQSNGALRHYMEHPLEMPGVLPFNRDSLYRDPT